MTRLADALAGVIARHGLAAALIAAGFAAAVYLASRLAGRFRGHRSRSVHGTGRHKKIWPPEDPGAAAEALILARQIGGVW